MTPLSPMNFLCVTGYFYDDRNSAMPYNDKSLHTTRCTGLNQINKQSTEDTAPMTEYSISQTYLTDTHFDPSRWSFLCSLHPAPVGGKWYKTTQLEYAQIRTISLAAIVDSMLCVDDLSETVKKGKTTEHGKMNVGIFAPVTWSEMSGARSKSKVELVHAMVFDFDGLTDEQMSATLSAFDGICHVAYSSFSHKSPAKGGLCAFRVIVPFDEPVPAADYITDDRRGVWYVVEQMMPHLDESTKDPSRYWFKPSYRVDRAGTEFTQMGAGAVFKTSALIDAGYAMNTGAPSASRTATPSASTPRPAATTTETESADAPERYRRDVVTGEHLITDATGTPRPFRYYIENWDSLQKNASGNIQCIADGGQSVGGAFISRRSDTLTGVCRYRCTSGRNRTHFDCIISDNGLEVSYSNRGGSWKPLDTVDNLILMVGMLDLDLWMDKRTGYVWFNGERFADFHYTEIQSLLRRRFFPSRRLGKMNCIDAVDAFCYQNQKDTLTEYLDSLEWDGVPRLQQLFIKYLHANDTQMNRIYAQKWAISAVARAYDWGCKVDTMLILKDVQGAGKSTFFSILAGTDPSGQSYFSDAAIDVRSVDGLTKLRLAWVHEWAELSGMNRSEVADVKKFLTTQTDQYRPKYGRKEVVAPRHSVIVGTVNDDEILQDSTGSRRFWIVEGGGTDGLRSYDPDDLAAERDALWAEAVHLYKAGSEWWLTVDEQNQSNASNTRFETVDVHVTMIEEWLDQNPNRVFTLSEMIDEVYTEEVETDAGSVVKRHKSVRPKTYLRWYSGALKTLGVTMMNDGKQCRYNGIRGRWYIAPDRIDDGVVIPSTVEIAGVDTNVEIRFDESTGKPVQIRQVGFDWVSIDDLPNELQQQIINLYDGGDTLRYNPNLQRYVNA